MSENSMNKVFASNYDRNSANGEECLKWKILMIENLDLIQRRLNKKMNNVKSLMYVWLIEIQIFIMCVQ